MIVDLNYDVIIGSNQALPDIFLSFSVFYCHLCGGGCDETDGDEPQVLLQGGLEHIRLYHRVALPPRAGHGKRVRSIRP